MDWFWTWGGISFGYRQGEDALYTHDGRHVGRFAEDGNIYALDGRYLGEVMNGDRLILDTRKTGLRSHAVSRYADLAGVARYTDVVGNAMIVGYEDFPAPDQL